MNEWKEEGADSDRIRREYGRNVPNKRNTTMSMNERTQVRPGTSPSSSPLCPFPSRRRLDVYPLSSLVPSIRLCPHVCVHSSSHSIFRIPCFISYPVANDLSARPSAPAVHDL
ncbi:hypothetical protein PTI98_010369 [Pleurotus ostreatus]|nr:hypothetical protein PTI98_010369 [Pleurotus ostreatus]